MDADSIFIEVTVGCTHNSCTFCNFYHGYPFRLVPLSQIEQDLQEAKKYYYVQGRSKVWASGGNPFALSPEKLIKLGNLFRSYLPDCKILTYARVDDICRKSVDELVQIRESGFDDIVVGIESADDDVLTHVNKGYHAADVLEGLQKLDQAGYRYRIIYLAGLAGKGKCVESARRTVQVLNQVHPHLAFLTMVNVLPGTKMYDEWRQGKWIQASEREKMREIRELVSGLNNEITLVQNSSTSTLHFTAHLPQDRESALDYIDLAIASFDDEDERRMAAYRQHVTFV